MPPKARIREIPSIVRADTRAPKVRGQRVAFLASRFHILVNTNYKFTSEARMQACIGALRAATQALPTPIYELKNWDMLKFFEWIAFGKKAKLPIEDSAHLYDTAIRKIKMVYVFEKGPINDFLHEHIDIQINHDSCIQFNHKQVYAYFSEALKGFPEITSLFIRIKRVKADMTNSYFKKNMMVAEGFDLSDSAKRAVHSFMDMYPSIDYFEQNSIEIPNQIVM